MMELDDGLRLTTKSSLDVTSGMARGVGVLIGRRGGAVETIWTRHPAQQFS